MRPVPNLTIPITLTRHVDEPLHEQIAGQVGAAIQDGLLPPRVQLPSTRSLAALLGVSRGVIIAAYELLFSRGCVNSRPGSGTFVAGRPAARPALEAPAPVMSGRPVVDLRPGQPSVEAFPLPAWRAAWRRAGFRRPPVQALPALGVPPLRRAISEHLLGTRGISLKDKEIVVTCGVEHGLAVVLDALGLSGPGVAVEEPCAAALWRVGGRPSPLPVDALGARVQEIPAHCRAIVLSADAQVPYGHVLSPERRAHVAAWARRTGGYVIEIACDTVLRPELSGVPRLSALAGDRSVLIGGFGELLTPAIRLGYAVVPRELAGEAARVIDRLAGQPSFMTQLAMESMLRDGTVVRLMHRLGRLYARKRRLVERAFAGLHGSRTVNSVVVPLPPAADAEEIAARLLERRVRVETLAPFHFSGLRPPPALVVGYGHLPDQVLSRALGTLVNAVRGDRHDDRGSTRGHPQRRLRLALGSPGARG